MSGQGKIGCVYLVGAGPGALDLVTLRARELIGQADVLVYDYLCNPAMLAWARPESEKIYAGKSGSAHTLSQDEINALLIAQARAGRKVVRLKGGDPYVFGRGGEEAQMLARAGVPFEEVPGVTSAIAAPAYAGIPVTHRDVASMVTFVTGHEDPSKASSALDWRQLAHLRGTRVFLMGLERLREIAHRLVAEGALPETPVALVRWGTTARQESLEGTLATIADLAEARGFKAPAITVIGDVVKLRAELNWYEALPLFGQRIVVTRSRRQAGGLARRLARLGADVLEIPTIRIVPVPLGEKEREKLTHLAEHYDWLVFTSPNTVELFFAEFFWVHGDVRALGAVRLAVVGPATAAKLDEFHLRAELQPETFTAEKLAAAFSKKKIASRRFCLPRGNRAEPLLAEHLREQGGLVDEWILYDTQPEELDPTGARARYLDEGAHWIAFTSASTAENWHALGLEPPAGSPRAQVVSMGPVTSEALRKLGYEIAAEAPQATLDSLVETISQLGIESSHGHNR
jgi:uroporphyrinogen III methyltransferase/synthase